MGREIRMVPPNWEHPTTECKHSPWAGGCDYAKQNGGRCLQPLHNQTFKEAAKEWKDEFASWERGERPSYCEGKSASLEYWEYNGAPPDREYYLPDSIGARTWFQVYETVSEGTPITPPFATKAELVAWLCANKDFWNYGPMTRAQAEAFVKDEWVPSMIIKDGVITQGMEISSAP